MLHILHVSPAGAFHHGLLHLLIHNCRVVQIGVVARQMGRVIPVFGSSVTVEAIMRVPPQDKLVLSAISDS